METTLRELGTEIALWDEKAIDRAAGGITMKIPILLQEKLEIR
jgi:hypothetical protein